MADNYHEVQVGDQKCFIKTSNTNKDEEKNVSDTVGIFFHPEGISRGVYTPSHYLYRKMGPAEFGKTLEKGGLVEVIGKDKRLGEKWVTESLEHTRKFHNRGSTSQGLVAELRVKKAEYQQIRENAIHQHSSRETNKALIAEGNTPNNIYHRELLPGPRGSQGSHPGPEDINICLKGDTNIAEFNEHVISIEKVDPESIWNNNKALHWVKNNKLSATLIALGILWDGYHLTLAIIDDKGIGKHTTVTASEIAAGKLGAYLGGLLGTALSPTAGPIICGIIGGILGSAIGSLTSFFFGYASFKGLGQPVGESMASHGKPPSESESHHGHPRSQAEVYHGLPVGHARVQHGFPKPSHAVRK